MIRLFLRLGGIDPCNGKKIIRDRWIDRLSRQGRRPLRAVIRTSTFKRVQHPIGCVAVAKMLGPFARARMVGKIDRDDAPFFKQTPPVARQVQPARQVDLRGRISHVVANPSRPMQEVRIITRETDETERRLHHRLLRHVDERCKLPGVGSVVFFREDQREVRRKRSMQLDDPRRSTQRDFILVSNDGVLAFGNRGACPFQERIPIRGEHVAPWKTKESPMHLVGLMVVVPNQSPEEIVQIGASERGLVFLRELERIPRGRHVPCVRRRIIDILSWIQLVGYSPRYLRPRRGIGSTGPGFPGASAETGANHDGRAAAHAPPQGVPDPIDVALVRKRHG